MHLISVRLTAAGRLIDPVRCLGFAVLLSVSQVTAAWGVLGHQLICDIAWRDLEPDSRQEIIHLLQSSGYRTFATACHWPDRIRDQERWRWTRPYHYINVPGDATAVTRRHCPASGCVLQGIEDSKRRLVTARNRRERLQALLFLSHYVGDIHQPMHVSYARDKGGNEMWLRLGDETINLHQLWDTWLVSPDRQPGWKSLGRQLSEQAAQESLGTEVMDPLAWADESLHLTREIYRNLPDDNAALDNAYLNRYRPVALRRIRQAGKRLALLLNRLLADQVTEAVNRDSSP